MLIEVITSSSKQYYFQSISMSEYELYIQKERERERERETQRERERLRERERGSSKNIYNYKSYKWASSIENLSLGFATRLDSYQPAQLLRLASKASFDCCKFN